MNQPRLIATALIVTIALAACGRATPQDSATPVPPTDATAPAVSTATAPAPSRSSRPTGTPSEVRPTIGAAEAWLVYQAYQGAGQTTIQLVRPDGSGDHPLLSEPRPGSSQSHPAWSADGQRIAFEVASGPKEPTEHAIWISDADGTDAHALITCSLPCLQVAYPAFSPDGRSIAYMRYEVEGNGEWGRSVIEIFDVDAGTSRAVATTPNGLSAHYTPRWSPDGKSLVVVLETYATPMQTSIQTSVLEVIDVDGDGKPRRLTPPGLFATAPDWSPGEEIVFNVADSEAAMIETASLRAIRSDGTGLRTITDTATGDPPAFEATWARDGSELLFFTLSAGSQIVTSLAPDGTGSVQGEWVLHTERGDVRRVHLHSRPLP